MNETKFSKKTRLSWQTFLRDGRAGSKNYKRKLAVLYNRSYDPTEIHNGTKYGSKLQWTSEGKKRFYLLKKIVTNEKRRVVFRNWSESVLVSREDEGQRFKTLIRGFKSVKTK